MSGRWGGKRTLEPPPGRGQSDGVSVQSVPYSPAVPGGRGGRCRLGDPEHPVKGEDSVPRRWDRSQVVPWEYICHPPPLSLSLPSTHRGAFGALLPQGTLRDEKRGEGHRLGPQCPLLGAPPCSSTPPRGLTVGRSPLVTPPGTRRHSPRAQGGRGGRWGRWGQPDPVDRDSVTPMSPWPSCPPTKAQGRPQTLTGSPLGPGGPWMPGSPWSPFSPISPGGPMSPIRPAWPWGQRSVTQCPHPNDRGGLRDKLG